MSSFKNFPADLRYFLIPGLKTKKKLLAEFRKNWGKEIDVKRDFELIAKYHSLTLTSQTKEMVGDNTWDDLNMDAVFAEIDRNVSAIGRQYLYRMLRIYENDKKILGFRNQQYEIFKSDQQLRESIQLILHRLSSDKASYVPHLIFDTLPAKPKFFQLIYLSSVITVASTFLMFFIKPFFFVLLAFGLINIAINAIYGKKVYEHFAGLSYLNVMLGAAMSLSELEASQDLLQLGYLRENKNTAQKLRKKIGWLVIDKSRLNDISEAFIEYLNLICLFDLVAFVRSIDHLKLNREKTIGIFKAVASLDAMISVASYLEGLSTYTVPEINQEPRIKVVDIYHPLLLNPVANSFRLAGSSALITGSNMAGKTTFIRTIGVNILLGRTVHICLARRCEIPAAIIRSSIRFEENLDEGKSYYFVEVEELLKFIRLSGDGKQYLFLIDEIYRGTNTIERVAAATAVLKYLNRNNTVLVTTHDIELQDLLDKEYDMYHFSEQVSGDNYFFDYKIKKGPTKSRNAIKLLELSGYPESVTEHASSLAREFSKRYEN